MLFTQEYEPLSPRFRVCCSEFVQQAATLPIRVQQVMGANVDREQAILSAFSWISSGVPKNVGKLF
jgi:hypothetical protein